MIYLVKGNDFDMSVSLSTRDPETKVDTPIDLTGATKLRLALVGHGMHVFAEDVKVRDNSANTVQGMIPGRSLLDGDYALEVTFRKGDKDKRFYVATDTEGQPLFVAVDRIESDSDDQAEGEGGGIALSITVQPENIDFSGAQGPAGKSAYQTWLDEGNEGSEQDFLDSLVGPQGPKGDKGDKGNKGDPGATGAAGAVGKSAYQSWLDQGNEGSEADFIASLKGATGEQGPQGETGAKGDKGDTGATGPQGPQGNQGEKGETGAQGSTGATGKSAYQSWLDQGNTGTEAEFLASLKGETGAKGDTGATGATGAQGPKGDKGDKGDTGATGAQGPKGDTGATGPQGPKGDQGDSGYTGAAGELRVVDNLESTDGTAALSANQGRVLNEEISQLGLKVDGFDTDTPVTEETTVNGVGINQYGGQITNAARTDYSVKVYRMGFGKSYHITIPKLTNAYTAAYGFMTEEQEPLSPSYKRVTLPDPIVKGPLTDYEADITAPSDTLIYLVVCYETAYGVPTVTTLAHTDGISSRLKTLEGKTETLEGEIDAIEEITTDTDETLYENEGQIEYYRNLGTATGWNGVGTSTPALATDVKINRVVFPPFRASVQGSTLKYFIGHRVYGTGVINTPETALTKIAEGTIENVGTSLDFAVSLQTPVTIPSGNQLIILLYCDRGNVYFRGGGTAETENAPYNSDDARAFLVTTSGLESPFEQYWSIATDKTTAQYKVCNPILKYEQDSDVKKIVNELVPDIVDEYLEDKDKVNVYLPNKLYAVVGDTLQLFFHGIVGVVNIADYDIYAECSKGKTFPRYFSYTPVVEDVGTTTLTVYVRDRKGTILGQASCDLVTVSAPSSPVSAKSIFTFGDSLTSQGQWPGEAKRRLVGNSTYDSITGKGLSNLAFYGYMTKEINGQSVDYFGVGGWTWANYLSKGVGGAFRFNVSGVSSLSIGAVYTNNGYSYTIQEINITGDSGNIRCTTSANTNTPTASGTLTKTSGDGDATITFASYETENANPLWDDANNKMSFVPYVQDCGASTIDAVYVLLSWNGQGSWKEYSVNDATGHIADAKTFARTLHTEYPNAKLFIMGLQMPSDTGGLGYNYGASGGLIDGQGVKQTAFNYNKALQDLCNDDEFSPYCEFVAIAPQFDSHFNMPYSTVKVNTRNALTEMLGRNGVHPSDAGYFQIADAVYRSIVANLCQSE